MNQGQVSADNEKQISPGVSWSFDGGTGQLVSVANSEITPGASYYNTVAGNSSVAPNGDVGLFKNAHVFGMDFGFLAPTLGSVAGNAYGVGTISGDLDGNGVFAVFFPVLESQWSETLRTHGLNNGGVTFNCSSVANSFNCQAESQLHAQDESVGFAGQYFQWDLTGTISSIPVPAAVWLFGTGLIGLLGVVHRCKAREL